MSDNISLNASMRSNLLSLQQTAKLQDITQNRLATGLKVSTAIDNPSSYYTAQSLNSRAEDLDALLNSMGQGIQTIKAANEALETGLKFLEQAKATANQALENINSPTGGGVVPGQPIAATVTTEAELLDAINNINPADGAIVIANDIALSKNIGLVLKDGMKLAGKTGTEKLTLEFDSTVSAIGIELAKDSEVSGLKINYTTNDSDYGDDFNVLRNSGHSGIKLSNLDIHLTKNSGYNDVAAVRNLGNGEISLEGTINIMTNSSDGALDGIWGEANAKIMQASDSILNITASGYYGNGIKDGTNILAGTVNITTLGENGYGIVGGTNTFSGNINVLTTIDVSEGIRGGNNTLSGTVNIRTTGYYAYGISYGILNITSTGQLLIDVQDVTSNGIEGLELSYSSGAKIGIKTSKDTAGAGYWQATADKTSNVRETYNTFDGVTGWNRLGTFPGIPVTFSARMAMPLAANAAISAATGDAVVPNTDLLAMANSYNSILEQFNQLVNDSGYKGVNLLKEQDLKVNFNEDRSSSVSITGKDASLKGLGLSQGEWKSAEDIEQSISKLEDAISQIRSMSSEFGNYYSIVSNREEFTDNLINVLTEGADKLALADMNEESANMLALQTRQQLAVNSLSLASQASQGVLKLF